MSVYRFRESKHKLACLLARLLTIAKDQTKELKIVADIDCKCFAQLNAKKGKSVPNVMTMVVMAELRALHKILSTRVVPAHERILDVRRANLGIEC
jgi:hypothetical protein